ncbi:potassium channel family protein [Clostridium vincentii]|uniref:Trk system potassium uptake protein TrkA n=1 Tax=Clostridium vincentii TaxID=52704 RepID=A0A2T0BDG7_9CLOT|nr:TrkA family potassium uptake protein [Clostridium vincentii]PRR81857.1 Trk system potassium uptake protein TrkA [Clostridium vincentii]
MKLHEEKEDIYILIIGCGRLGASIANSLSNRNMNVTIIDSNKDSFRKLSPSFGGLALEGDATDIDILKEAQIEKSRVVVCVTNNDSSNIMIAQMAKKLFSIERVIARLYDPERECVYNEFGINTIFPSILSANEVDKLLAMDERMK